jgi:HK97 family phage major capsid protein
MRRAKLSRVLLLPAKFPPVQTYQHGLRWNRVRHILTDLSRFHRASKESDMDPRIKALQDRRTELLTSMKSMLAGGSLTEEQGQQYDAMEAECKAIPDKVKAVEAEIAKDAARASALAQLERTPLVQSRQSTQDTTRTDLSGGGLPAVTIKSEVMTMDEIRTQFASCSDQKPYILTADNGGFRSLGEQLQAIAGAETQPQYMHDPRLHYGKVTPQMVVSGAGAGTPTDGGYLIQKDLQTELADKSYGGDPVLSRVRRFGCSQNSDGLTMNLIDETSRASGSRWGGVQVYYGAEADSATAKKPKFRQQKWELKDVIGLMYATDRLLADAGMLQTVFMEAFSSEIRFFVGNGVINDTGAGQIQGLLTANCLVSVAKETGQAANTIQFENVNKMWSRMWARSRPNAVWLINQDCEPALDSMSIPVGTGGMPVYLPAGGLSDDRLARLKGAPVIPTEFNPTLGTKGDIMLVDLSQYLLIDKGGPRGDSSIHVRFINNETTFRFIYRVDGQPLWNSALTPAKGSNTLSPFVALDTRA